MAEEEPDKGVADCHTSHFEYPLKYIYFLYHDIYPRGSSKMESPTATFKHSPLVDQFNEIRLLDLQPGQRGDMLEISIRHARLNDDYLDFEALSYTWGAESASHHVSINGLQFAIRPNLFHCLNELRLPTDVQTLWIDAISIDQANVAERNHQVRSMDRIYTYASVVRIWLGAPSSWTKELFEFLNTTAAQQASLPSHKRHSLKVEEMLLGESDRETPILRALVDICSRPYWERAWILQEVMLSGIKILHCGSYKAPWNVFYDVLKRLSEYTWEIERVFRLFKTLRSDYMSLSGVMSTAGLLSLAGRLKIQPTLEVLLEEYGESACTDIRDRVYALLSLAKDHTTEHFFPIDYAEDKCILFFRAIIFCKPRNHFDFASRLLRSLGLEKAAFQRYLQLNAGEIKSKQLEIQLSAYYIGNAADISFSSPDGTSCSGWKHVKKESVLGELMTHETVEGRPIQLTNCSHIKMYQIEGSPLGILLASTYDKDEVTFTPVIVQQVRSLDDSDEVALVLHKSSEKLHGVTVNSEDPLYDIGLSVQPESFLWLLIESEKWIDAQQPWKRAWQRQRAEGD
jgi:hypothetical protein